MFPLPFQGHINPMLQLADVLHGRGLAVTMLHTNFNKLDPALHPAFDFVPVLDGIPAEVAASGDVIAIIEAMNASMEVNESAALRDVIESVLAEQGQPPAACIIYDANLLAVPTAAAALGLPTLVLRTASAACLGCFLAYPMLHEKGYLPPQADAMKKSAGLLINTFDALEMVELERIREQFDIPIVLAVGPLHKLSYKTTGSSLLDQDYSCIQWLDKQPSRYVEKRWGVGFELEGKLERGKIEMAIRKLMKERDGYEMRKRAMRLKEKVADCLKPGGSSRIAIDKLVQYIHSL
ncbi:hypothetical protein EJB05_13384, partial [Eragrostis curvula]